MLFWNTKLGQKKKTPKKYETKFRVLPSVLPVGFTMQMKHGFKAESVSMSGASTPGKV